jgi:site-specific DNA-methyltransferase (adenine-specific)
MDIIKDFPDNSIDLAIVDPPYGIKEKLIDGGPTWKLNKSKGGLAWDVKPTDSYFKNLFRTSRNQIIWGGNYFIEQLYSTNCVIIWDKEQIFSTGEFEVAWTSFNSPCRSFKMSRIEAYSKGKIHPTQKPIQLYRWLLQNYAKPGNLILDTHSGSGSCAIACHLEGFDFIAIEKDDDYHRDSMNRLETERSQQRMFV